MTLKIKFAWVWYGIVWYMIGFLHFLIIYDFIGIIINSAKKEERPCFFPKLIFNNGRTLFARDSKYPNQIIPSHGLIAILDKMENRQTEVIVAFLESENVDQGIDTIIQGLKSQENNIPSNGENRNALNRSSSLEKIHTRTYVFALNVSIIRKP